MVNRISNLPNFTMFSLRPAAGLARMTMMSARAPVITAQQRFRPATQRLMATASTNKLTDVIKEDHKHMAEAINIIKTARQENDYDTQIRWQNQLIWEVARHSVAEEIVVYPAFERFLINGEEMADKDRKEHLQVCHPSYSFLSTQNSLHSSHQPLLTLMTRSSNSSTNSNT